MAIYEVSDDYVLQRCQNCRGSNRIALDSLKAGVAKGGFVNPHIVPLPACPSCGSVGFLVRSPDDESEHPAPGSFTHLHRLLVDHVHGQLVRRGRIRPELEKHSMHSLLAKTTTEEELARWFPGDSKVLRLKLPEESGERPNEMGKRKP